jgi:hypothetical protein
MGTVNLTNARTLGHFPHFRGKAVIYKCTMSSSYATGGDTISLAQTPFQRILFIAPLSKFGSTVKVRGQNVLANGGGAAFVAAGTPTAPKIQSFVGDATPTQTANATNLSTVSFDVLIVGQ